MKERRKRFIKIQDGCDKFCYYCLTVHRRGRSKSLSIERIVEQVIKAENNGKEQAILTGVDVGDFKPSLSKLLTEVLGMTEEILIGFGSVNLVGVTDELIKLWRENQDRMVNYLHIPLQSGCNETLKRMNRKHTIKEYIKAVEKLRDEIKEIKIGTDVMVGYPGETGEEFGESFKNIKKFKLDKLHVFRYSERKETVAEKKGKEWGLVSEEEKKKRAELMRGLGKYTIKV